METGNWAPNAAQGYLEGIFLRRYLLGLSQKKGIFQGVIFPLSVLNRSGEACTSSGLDSMLKVPVFRKIKNPHKC